MQPIAAQAAGYGTTIRLCPAESDGGDGIKVRSTLAYTLLPKLFVNYEKA